MLGTICTLGVGEGGVRALWDAPEPQLLACCYSCPGFCFAVRLFWPAGLLAGLAVLPVFVQASWNLRIADENNFLFLLRRLRLSLCLRRGSSCLWSIACFRCLSLRSLPFGRLCLGVSVLEGCVCAASAWGACAFPNAFLTICAASSSMELCAALASIPFSCKKTYDILALLI